MKETIMYMSVLLVISVRAVVIADSLPVNNRVVSNPIVTERGAEIMRLKGIENAIGGRLFLTWDFPSAIEVRGETYHVSSDSGIFTIASSTDLSKRIIVGSVSRVNDSRTAMICGLGSLSMNNMNVGSVANLIGISRFTAGSNTVYHAHWCGSRYNDALICNNMYVRMNSTSVTNGFDFAVSLLNAGLPESDRLPPLQPQSNP